MKHIFKSMPHILLLMVVCDLGLAQAPSYLPEGLHKLSREEMTHEDYDFFGVSFYMNGKEISYTQGPKLRANPEYTLDYYADEKGDVKAIVVRLSTAEEKEIREDPNTKAPDPAGWNNALPPEFKVMDIEGNEVDIVALEGKVVVLNFWFIGCKPCVKEIPKLNKLVKKYKDKEVIFLGLALDKRTSIETFVDAKPFKYTLIPRARSVARKFGVELYPTHYVIDKEGLVRLYRKGYGPGTVGQIDREITRRLRD